MTLFTTAQARAVADLLREAAAVEIRPRFRRLAAADIRAKTGPLDLVTEADEAAERHITAGLQRLFPGCLVVGEEAASANPSLLDGLAGAELAFVVDPVDGTSNFAAGLPLFGCMAAAIIRGETVAGIIHDPMGDDTAIAVRGEGAWTESPDGRQIDLRVAAPVPLAEMAGAASWRFLPEPQRSQIHLALPKLAASFQYRCAAHEYRMLAGGHCHYLLYGRLYPWDHAPGVLLHLEAGGYSARFDGSPYLPSHTTGGLICTPDQQSWQALHDALLEDAYSSV
jgi:fructose-1,6-bisphosphatase/inositol monophosphatase family enzyme